MAGKSQSYRRNHLSGCLRRRTAVIAGAGSEVDDDGYFVSDRVSARLHLKSGEVDANDVTHMDAARNQIIGSSAGLIPFIEKNYVYRSLMGSNQQRQAVPLIQPASPIVGTGLETDGRPQHRPGHSG